MNVVHGLEHFSLKFRTADWITTTIIQ